MTTLESLLFELETLKQRDSLHAETVDKCAKLAEGLLKQEQWELDRAYDQGWLDCSNKK